MIELASFRLVQYSLGRWCRHQCRLVRLFSCHRRGCPCVLDFPERGRVVRGLARPDAWLSTRPLPVVSILFSCFLCRHCVAFSA